MSLIDALPLLPRPVARHTLFILTEALPPPLGDLPEERAARDESAIAAVVALHPVDAQEARLAARSVAADAWAMDCLHLAGERIRLDPDMARRCHREAALMMRAADSALRSLRIMQSARAKADTTPTLGESPEPAHAEAEPQPPSAAPVQSEPAARANRPNPTWPPRQMTTRSSTASARLSSAAFAVYRATSIAAPYVRPWSTPSSPAPRPSSARSTAPTAASIACPCTPQPRP